jgi:hypothetical protein
MPEPVEANTPEAKPPEPKKPRWLFGVPVGIAFGAILGYATGQWVVWLPFGAFFGFIISSAGRGGGC